MGSNAHSRNLSTLICEIYQHEDFKPEQQKFNYEVKHKIGHFSGSKYKKIDNK